jgi:NitT/TauT family transport system ATP-binding protein
VTSSSVTAFANAPGPAFGPGAPISSSVGVSIKNVSHIFEGRAGKSVHALDGVSLEIPLGTMAAIIGPSGCGKSTLLYIVGGLLEPSKGTAYVEGQPAMTIG